MKAAQGLKVDGRQRVHARNLDMIGRLESVDEQRISLAGDQRVLSRREAVEGENPLGADEPLAGFGGKRSADDRQPAARLNAEIIAAARNGRIA